MGARFSGRSAGGLPRHAAGIVLSCALLLVVSGCVSQKVADTANRRLNNGMSTSELETARRVALRQVREEGAIVTARATVSPAAPSAGSRPRPCTSGRMLHITMTGQFPHHPTLDRPGSPPVLAQELTVDAATGRLCGAHYLTYVSLTDPTAVLLFSL